MMSRRTLIGGLLAGGSVAATGAWLTVRDDPGVRSTFGEKTRLSGFVGGEKMGFLQDAEVRSLLSRNGLEIDARQAGSVEMVSEKALLDQAPDFLWPSSQPMVDIARRNGVKIRREDVVLNSPIVLYSWENVAEGLVSTGMARRIGERRFTVDTAALLRSVVEKRLWSQIGVKDIYGAVRVVSTDPTRSNSGYVFSGLAANVLSDGVADAASVERVRSDLGAIFSSMGFKTHSSGKLFDDYIAGGSGAMPIAVGYENQLLEWILADRDRWARIEQRAPVKPVILYPTPTVFTAHPLIVVTEKADRLLEVLMSEEAQSLAWRLNGFRGPLGSYDGEEDEVVSRYVEPSVTSIVPMPDGMVMDTVMGMLTT